MRRFDATSNLKYIDGKTAYVEILVEVPSGQSASAAKSRALEKQNAGAASSRGSSASLDVLARDEDAEAVGWSGNPRTPEPVERSTRAVLKPTPSSCGS